MWGIAKYWESSRFFCCYDYQTQFNTICTNYNHFDTIQHDIGRMRNLEVKHNSRKRDWKNGSDYIRGIRTWPAPLTLLFSSFCWLTSWFSVLFIVSLIIKVKLTFNLLLFIWFSFQIESVKLFYFSPFFMLTLSQYLLSVICTLLFTFIHLFIICLVNKGELPIPLKYINWI